MTVFGAKGY